MGIIVKMLKIMADEVKITPDKEVKDVEGTVAAEVAKTEEVKAPEDKGEKVVETVPLAVYLDLKEDLKNLKHEIKESKGTAKDRVEIQGLAELAQKYPDVNKEFIEDMLNSATKEATKTIEAKYTPILEKQELEKKQASFDKAFDNLFEKTLTENPELPKNIDKEVIKELALTPKYRNTPLVEILTKMYGNSTPGKGASENEVRSGSDVVGDVVNFDKITPEQKTAIMADAKVRQKYFDWLDTQTGR